MAGIEELLEEEKGRLLSAYAPPLDESTVLAIISDFDLSNTLEVEQARRVLDVLKEGAEGEDGGAYEASGCTLPQSLHGNGSGDGEGDTGSIRSAPEWESNTDDTSLSQGLSSLDLDDDSNTDDRAYMGELEALDEEGKVAILSGIFSSLKTFDVKFTLRKCDWDVNKAIDQLMTESFLEENGGRQRGVEAFSESDLPLVRKGKGKRKKKGRGIGSECDSPGVDSPVDSPTTSKWDTARQDIEFISTRTGSPPSQISTLYHKNNASIRNTILAIIDVQLALKIESDDPIIQSKTIDLAHEFPTISSQKLEAIIQITHPSSTYAHDLATAIIPPATKPNIQIELRHAPLNLHPPTPSPSPLARKSPSDIDLETSTAEISKYTTARDAAFQQARSAYRRGKSDHLMGGVAAYYSQQGRDADAAARRAMSEAADARVAAQSSRFEVDLHGCTVLDAKRIAREEVARWWVDVSRNSGAGDGRRAGDAVRSLKVVTGRGNHSEGRAGKLGPAVGKMLITEGWRIEVTPGFLMVRGLAGK